MKDPRWHVRLVTNWAITDFMADYPLPSDAAAEALEKVCSSEGEEFRAVTITENPLYRKQQDRDRIAAYNEIRDSAPEMTREEQLAETQLRG